MSASPVQVDMVSDFVCPWCWLGYAQYAEAARTALPPPELTFRPYMLDPSVPDEGQDYRAYMQAKFGEGSADRFKASREHLLREGEALGIHFDFDAITRRPNSLNAHRVLKWAQGQSSAKAHRWRRRPRWRRPRSV